MAISLFACIFSMLLVVCWAYELYFVVVAGNLSSIGNNGIRKLGWLWWCVAFFHFVYYSSNKIFLSTILLKSSGPDGNGFGSTNAWTNASMTLHTYSEHRLCIMTINCAIFAHNTIHNIRVRFYLMYSRNGTTSLICGAFSKLKKEAEIARGLILHVMHIANG